MSTQFESAIAQLTQPINGQFPRPWMTDLSDPLSANVFIVGKNQRNGYDTSRLNHERHFNALFNRNGQSCRELYDELTQNKRSPTRQHTDRFRQLLEGVGVTRILETNVVCYSTPMSADLKRLEHTGGTDIGSEIFLTLLDFIKPRVLIAHGAGTCKALGKLLNTALPALPTEPASVVFTVVGATTVFVVPSLAPPKWNTWQNWADEHLGNVALAVAGALGAEQE